MADFTSLDALQAFHRELIALNDGHGDGSIDNEVFVENFERELERVWERPKRNEASRNSIKSGKISLDGKEFSINDKFQQDVLILSDELEIEELDAARFLLESQDDTSTLGRSLIECAIIRFHQQRKYALDILRVLLEIYSLECDDDEPTPLDGIKAYVEARILQSSATGQKRSIPRYMATMAEIKTWLQKLGDKIAAAQNLGQSRDAMSEEMETVEFSRISLIQQHELLGVILCRAIAKRQAETADFLKFVGVLKQANKYDCLLIHLLPALGAFIAIFGSPDGGMDLTRVRELNSKLFATADDSAWPLPYLQATFKTWWLAEYAGYYIDDPPGVPDADLDKEAGERTKAFGDALKDGAFDFLLTAAADVRPPDWHDPVRTGMRKWLQRKSTPLAADIVQFSDFFQLRFMSQLELFIDAFITNLPDVLRKLRVEEDEQRQLSQIHEDLDLERFILIIAYSYERRPDAAAAFWADPDSNLAGFMHWASRRASTPLVAAFCEMLQAIAENDECATAAHEFLLDEGHHSSGKMRRSQSLTWAQILRELDFFSDKIKQKPMTTPTLRHRNAKPSSDVIETEPESAMMLECYFRLMTKLASESDAARLFLLQTPDYNIVDTLFDLASCQIPSRLRGCIFMALKALMSRKTLQESNAMWLCLDNWSNGGYTSHSHSSSSLRPGQPQQLVSMDRILDEMSNGFDEPEALTKLLLELVSPAVDSGPLNDSLTFGESLISAARPSGIEAYIDFVIGLVFTIKAQDLQDVHQTRVLRLTCLEFMLTCLSTFNEDLIIMANNTNLTIDSSIATNDLATYVKMHPFGRVMEWMYNDKVMTALFHVVHQEPLEVGNAAPDSPLILGILRAVELIAKVMDLENTYLELVRPLIKKSDHQRHPVANASYASFADGLVTRLHLVVDLGNYCGIGHPDLTLSCLQLLGKMSSSSRIAAEWSGSSRAGHRNKAVVAMEANGEHESISRAFISELQAPLEPGREADSASYITKRYVLDFLHQCLLETPKRPTIAHLLLGFKCGADSLSIDSGGAFANRTSLFHSLLRLLLELPSSDAQGMRGWLISIKCRVMRILQVLWDSPLSSKLTIEELRENEFFFHLLIRETVIQPSIPWEGQDLAALRFPVTDGATALSDFLILRRLVLEYFSMELCMISQGRMPSVKRRIFEALNGQILGDDNERIQTPTIFDLYDFLLPYGIWEVPVPTLEFYKDLDISICLEHDGDGNVVHNLDRVREMILLKRGEKETKGKLTEALATVQTLATVEREEAVILEHLASTDRQQQIARQSLHVLKSWTKLLLVMVECNDFDGTVRTSFFLQTLQAILPSLESFASDRPVEAMDLAKLARILLSRLDLKESSTADKQGKAIGNLIHDKLLQLFQICLQAISKWAGTPELRAVYYEICYRYLTGAPDEAKRNFNIQIIKTLQVYGERLINVICDDAFCGETGCQSAAYILLNVLVNISRQEDEDIVVDTLNRLNFIGVVVDTLRNVMNEWHAVFGPNGSADQQNHQNAKLALLLQLAQTRPGAKYVLYANIFRAVEQSGLFTADPELLQLSSADGNGTRALEQHYDLLAKVVRIIGAALLSRGSHSIVQGRKFLTEHRMLVTHTLKRSAGIGGTGASEVLEEKVDELAEALMVVIAATGFIEFDNATVPEPRRANHGLFH